MDLVGQMRKVVYLCLNQPTAQGAGATDNYGVLLSTRGALKKYSGSRSLLLGEIEGQTSYELTVRYQVAIEQNISISSKFVIDNVWYTISFWEKVDELNYYYKFRLNKTEPVATGSVDLTPISETDLDPNYLTTVPGENTVTSTLLQQSGISIVLLARSGIIFTQVSGVPANHEYRYSDGVITFATTNPFNAGEIIYILPKKTV
jgi:hypothetical protein